MATTASAFTIFEPRPICKRKRVISNEPEELASDDDRKAKRPLNRRSKSKVYAQLPTPDDSSEDEDVRMERNTWYQRRALARKSSVCSMNSVNVNLDEWDSDLDICMSPVIVEARAKITPTLGGRPHLALVASVPVTVSIDGRLPTPTAILSIDTALRASARRSWHSQLHTKLSPLLAEEVGMLSPTLPLDQESMMLLDRASDTLSGLSVCCPDDSMHVDGDHKSQTSSIDFAATATATTQRQDNGRTATLHMGYRNNCEKCTMHVPGHYSHILWS